MCARVRACICARVRMRVARAIGFSRRRSKRSYLTRHFRIGGIATIVCIVAVYLRRDPHTREIGTSRGRDDGSDNRLPL